eukprot:GHVS01020202.1.p1 GENE.GHVS01020202.1~~GHVS01020202.1.p1  ORF type:complete len:1401 (+),score=180.46 GHVS01020202.1:137-4339(+)
MPSVCSCGPYEVVGGRGDDGVSEHQQYTLEVVFGSYRLSRVALALYISGCIASCGMLYILNGWFPMLLFSFLHKPTPVSAADFVLLRTESGDLHIRRCWRARVAQAIYLTAMGSALSSPLRNEEMCRPVDECGVEVVLFEFCSIRYIHCLRTGRFQEVSYPVLRGEEELLKQQRWDHATLESLRSVYGPCVMDVPLVSAFRLLVDEIISPFYLFQVAAIGLWLWDHYYQYAITISLITAVSTIADLYESWSNQYRLHRLATFDCDVIVLREGVPATLNSRRLVPGDVIELSEGMTVPCDLALLNGESVVMESMLTGECIPVIKTSGENAPPGTTRPSSTVLYAGTRVLRTVSPNGVWGLVIRTGFGTVQGHMLRPIVYPSADCSMQFNRDAMTYIAVLAFGAVCGACVGLWMGLSQGLAHEEILSRCLDLFTQIVPPALPAALSVGMSIAIARLQHYWHISCICPSRILVSGQVNTFVFDKTGTLTDEGLDFYACLPVVRGVCGASGCSTAYEGMDSAEFVGKLNQTFDGCSLIHCMATCHSVVWVAEHAVGDPLELLMLEYSQWALYDPRRHVYATVHIHDRPSLYTSDSSPHDGLASVQRGKEKLVLVKRFEFAAALQRMSVIVEDGHGSYVYCKGAPERVRQLCVNVTSDFDDAVDLYTKQGMRLLAFAGRRITSPYGSRRECERDLIFLGLLVFDNKLKPSTTSSLSELLSCGCHCVMSTGDNPLTATAVAHNCGLIPSDVPVVLLGDIMPASLVPLSNSSSLEGAAADLESYDHMPDTAAVVWTVVRGREGRRSTDIGRCLSGVDPRDVALVVTGRAFSWLHQMYTQQRKAEEQGRPRVSSRKMKSCQSVLTIPLLSDVASPRLQLDEVLTPNRYDVDQTAHGSPLGGSLAFHSSSPSRAQHSPISLPSPYHSPVHGMPRRHEPRRCAVSADPSLSPWRSDGEGWLAGEWEGSRSGSDADSEDTDTGKAKKDRGVKQSRKLRRKRGARQRVSSEVPPGLEPSEGMKIMGRPSVGSAPDVRFRVREGAEWRNEDVSLFEFVLCNTKVFARMSPEDKTMLVAAMQSLPAKPLVGMCGDGANDCGALKKADVGVALSAAEASIAAPFTSADYCIQSCNDVLREGRAALATSFQMFKFIVFSAVMQFMSVMILYGYGNNLTDSQYLWLDLVVVLPLSMFIPWTEASADLSSSIPMRHVCSIPMVASVVGQVVIQIAVQAVSLVLLSLQNFYNRFHPNIHTGQGGGEDLVCQENTVVFLILNMQLAITCLVTSSNYPWRRAVWTNRLYSLWLLLLISVGFIFLSSMASTALQHPASSQSLARRLLTAVCHWLWIAELPQYFRNYLAALLAVNSLLILSYEKLVVGLLEARQAAAWYKANHISMKTPAGLPRQDFDVQFRA